jgi:protein SCO1/2
MSGLKHTHLFAYLSAGALALALGFWAGGMGERGSERAAIELESGTAMGHAHRPVPSFELADHRGRPFGREQLQGRWSFMFFGYTHCPDICPMTMAVLAQATQEIVSRDPDADHQVVFVSVDPQRDEGEQLARYVTYFNPEFVGVTGPKDQIDALTLPLGIVYAQVDNPNGGDYLVDHSGSILLINPRGEVEALLRAPHTPETIATDFGTLLDHYPG